ncbi:MAG: type II toxin-antitoxin system RelE/ParE family toxin [Candidatus Bipolaricaulis sp.]|nr:type II toxin-antitoxin system RelE/ParE family toxin [Candidatus Bipolaricaulis sp.]
MTTGTPWNVLHYEAEDGGCPVEDFLDRLSPKERAKVLATIALLEEKGPELCRPYADFLKDGIHELRVRVSTVRYRVFYFFCHRQDIVLTHGFKKKVKRVPETEIRRAGRYRDDWLRRQNEDS